MTKHTPGATLAKTLYRQFDTWRIESEQRLPTTKLMKLEKIAEIVDRGTVTEIDVDTAAELARLKAINKESREAHLLTIAKLCDIVLERGVDAGTITKLKEINTELLEVCIEAAHQFRQIIEYGALTNKEDDRKIRAVLPEIEAAVANGKGKKP